MASTPVDKGEPIVVGSEIRTGDEELAVSGPVLG
jgi:hypothetical protein